MPRTFIDTERKRLLSKYHSLCHRLGMSDDARRDMLWQNFQVESGVQLDNHQLIDLCYTLEQHANARFSAQNRERKRAIAAIGGYLRLFGKEKPGKAENLAYIKSIACRATQYDDFNAIPTERLRNLYNTFRNKQTDHRAVEQLLAEDTMVHQLLAASAHAMAEA